MERSREKKTATWWVQGPLHPAQSNRTVQLDGTCRDHRVRPPDHFRANQELKHVVEGIVQMPLAHRQAWDINHLARQPVPAFDHPHSAEIFPHVHSEPPLAQLCAIPSRPVLSDQGAETGTSLSASPLGLLFSRLDNPSVHRTCLPAHLPALLPSTRYFQAPWHPFYTVKPRTAYNIQGEATPVSCHTTSFLTIAYLLLCLVHTVALLQ